MGGSTRSRCQSDTVSWIGSRSVAAEQQDPWPGERDGRPWVVAFVIFVALVAIAIVALVMSRPAADDSSGALRTTTLADLQGVPA